MEKDLRSKCVDRLKSFDGNITSQDKADACKELNISRPTIEKYLSGDVFNVDLAISLIKFLTRRITSREKELTRA